MYITVENMKIMESVHFELNISPSEFKKKKPKS